MSHGERLSVVKPQGDDPWGEAPPITPIKGLTVQGASIVQGVSIRIFTPHTPPNVGAARFLTTAAAAK